MEGRGTMAHPGKSTAMERGVCGSALELHPGREGDHRGRLGPEPDWGNPTVRDRRGGLRKRGPWWNEDPTSRIERASVGNSPPKVARAAVLSRPLKEIST